MATCEHAFVPLRWQPLLSQLRRHTVRRSRRLRQQVPRTEESQLAAIAGTVVKASTGEPLKKAQVVMNKEEEIRDEHPLYAITDAAGHFSIERISPGRYNLEARRAGYLTARYGQGQQPDRRGAVFTLAVGQKISDLLFRLQRNSPGDLRPRPG